MANVVGNQTVSPNGSSLPGEIVDTAGNAWTIEGGVVKKNGSTSGAGSTSGVILLLYFMNAGGNLTFYQQASNLSWWSFDGTNWNAEPGDPRTVVIGTGGSPAPQPSASGTTIPPATQIIDKSGNIWTVTSGKKVNFNGAAAGATANVAQLLFFNNALYHQNTTGNWYAWNGSNWGTGPLSGGDPRGTTSAPPPSTTPNQLTSTLGTARSQQPLNHVATPLGVPAGYSWQAHGNIQAGNTVPGGYTAMTSWGQVFQVSGSPNNSPQLLLRNYKVYLLTNNNQLIQVQSPSIIQGAQFLPDYSGNSNTGANIVNNAGVMSVNLQPGKAFQFWPNSRVDISAQIGNIKGWVCAIEAQLAAGSSNTNFLLSLGADYWKTTSAPYPNNQGIGQGQMRYLTTTWTPYVFTSETDSTLDSVVFNT